MFTKHDILYEDNHIIAVNKHSGDLVQSDTEGTPGLEDEIKEFIRVRDQKPGEVFLGVVHRIDRPVSGVVIFAKTSKALVRLNEMVRQRDIDKRYWAVCEEAPEELEGTLVHFITRDGKTNKAVAYNSQKGDAKRAELQYKMLGGSKNYKLLEIKLITGRHHQIRCQLAKMGCPIKGDLKYGFARSNPDGSICLHARRISFIHPVSKEQITVEAPLPSSFKMFA